MSNERTALGGMLKQLVGLGAISSDPSRSTPSSSGDSKPSGPLEPAQTVTPTRSTLSTGQPASGADAVTEKPPTPAGHHSTTRNSLPASSSSPSFSTPIPSSASIKSRRCSTAPTKPSSTRSTTWEPVRSRLSRTSGNAWVTRSLGPRRSMKLSRFARGSKARTHRETDCLAAGRQSPAEHDGQESRATR